MMLLLAVFLVLTGLHQQFPPTPPAPPDPDLVYIDGRKNPEKIPQWAVWEAAFNLLATGKKAGGILLDRELQLSAAEKALVYAEAQSHRARWEAHRKEVLTELEPLVGKTKQEELMQRNRAMILEYRQQVLEGSERLLERLSPDGRAWLVSWVEERKAGMTLTVAKSQLDFFMRPH